MTAPPPMIFHWTGEAFVPRQPRYADRHYVVGEDYRLVVEEERSKKSHDQYFAELDDKWGNLPDYLLEEYPSRESLRHKALIRCGYCTERDWVFGSEATASTFAAAMIEGDEDRYCIIDVRGCVVRKYKALSQKRKAMDKKVFQASKQAVFDFVDKLLGVETSPQPRQVAAPALAPEQQRLADCQNEHPDETALAGVGRGRR